MKKMQEKNVGTDKSISKKKKEPGGQTRGTTRIYYNPRGTKGRGPGPSVENPGIYVSGKYESNSGVGGRQNHKINDKSLKRP